MKAFNVHTGLVCPLDRVNVDTDAIIPKQYLKSIKRTGFGPFLFDDWRYNTAGDLSTVISSREVNTDFVMNLPQYAGASILMARDNFGCGSSREHAVWALDGYGFRAVLAPSFADIFFNNSFKNGFLPIVVADEVLDRWFAAAEIEGFELTIDLPNQEIRDSSGQAVAFEIDPFRKKCLIEGLDDIDLTLLKSEKIKAFEAKQPAWLKRA
ncbi:MAG: 3-isopropylmalate/(R)-2-methylmalate dehydratase small subunit [Gammaproteobacteria bacterium]|jgi:3-isopropylmalate/(R)-2-methylmalate dehydratase small subunit